MEKQKQKTGGPVRVLESRFRGSSGWVETQWSLEPTEWATVGEQLSWLESAYLAVLGDGGLTEQSCVFRRFFCSDLKNQARVLENHPISSRTHGRSPASLSWIGQPPAYPAKVALWVCHVSHPQRTSRMIREGNVTELIRHEMSHFWISGIDACGERPGGTASETTLVFERLQKILLSRELSLEKNVLRTWFYVWNVDDNYGAFVRSRNEVFGSNGLTSDTHFIASTGIQGLGLSPDGTVTLDAYAIRGVEPRQIQYLNALEYLSPTALYGVSFERGTMIRYRDRRHLWISGTASIDSEGGIVAEGDLLGQMERTLLNIEKLLGEGGAKVSDLMEIIVYLRDPADHHRALDWLEERLPGLPCVIVTAPVCRPGWLVEIEGRAIVPNEEADMPEF